VKRLSLWAIWGFGGFVLVFALGNAIPASSVSTTRHNLKVWIGTLPLEASLAGRFRQACCPGVWHAWYFAKRTFVEETFPGWTGMPAAYYRDAVVYRPGVERSAHRLADDTASVFPALADGASFRRRGFRNRFRCVFSFRCRARRFAAAQFVVYRCSRAGSIFYRVADAGALVAGGSVLDGNASVDGGNWGTQRISQAVGAELVVLSAIFLGVRYVMRFNILVFLSPGNYYAGE